MSLEPQQDASVENGETVQTGEAKGENPENFWVETIKTIGISVILALGMRQFVAEARYIPSGSMEPTLLVDDRLIIDKVTYRFSNPQRGDIVVFDPTDTLHRLNYNEAFIKRVIGLPGDKVEVHNDLVTINGKPLTENYPSANFPDQMTKIYIEKNQKDPRIGLWNPENKGPEYTDVVPAGQYLVLGDHRSSSLDGRAWGFVPKDKIVGKATLRFWPLNRMGGIDPKPSYAK
jgi:signal peptidase I